MAKFLNTSNISSAISDVIVKAKEYIVIMSPYLKLRPLLIQRLRTAGNKNVDIHFIIGKEKPSEDEIKQLRTIKNLEISYYQELHAKCYLNEKTAIIASMNLYEYSELNNREMGILVNREKKEDEELYNEIFEECNDIHDHSAEFYKKFTFVKTTHCISCKASRGLTSWQPYCTICYTNWVNDGKPNNRVETYCNKCGNKRNGITYSKPICYDCKSIN
ncbi:phospholipase D family protein [Xanthocytophaga agilis]|uniref:Phospholipase D family protein n=1 Tax=Xanthocytophaga agilis TaxID=3048010 RepID=A0AAE3RE17_9BACT|nr:phospholipase D family protein [Xanthocytophaga agilis]MDJ1506839.1 phospholipase D family protein [Xanthocytophaga agilis]